MVSVTFFFYCRTIVKSEARTLLFKILSPERTYKTDQIVNDEIQNILAQGQWDKGTSALSYHLSELAGQTGQFVDEMGLYEDLFLQVHQHAAHYLQID